MIIQVFTDLQPRFKADIFTTDSLVAPYHRPKFNDTDLVDKEEFLIKFH